MSLFTGIHETRVKTGRGVLAGYFESEALALSAVERLGDYTAAWATLNPLRPDVLTPDTAINPTELARTLKAAADAHILCREWLLLDFDPERPAGVGSTDAEKAAAHQQAGQCRCELAEMGWPLPAVIDSGNGFHLRYRIDLHNDAAAAALARAVLRQLAERYPMLDVTNHNAARVAKLPGTWARKGEHTDERPHRISALLSEGSGTVTETQLQAIAGDMSTADYATREEITSEEAKAALEWLLGYLEHHELAARTEARRIPGGWKVGIFCPFAESHDDGSDTSTVLQIISGRLSFSCAHNTCKRQERNTAAFKREMWRRHGAFRREPADLTVLMGGARSARRSVTAVTDVTVTSHITRLRFRNSTEAK